MTNFDESPVTHSAMLQRLSGFFAAQESGVVLVGGYLRDTLRSATPARDVDIALPGDAQKIGRELARFLGGTFVPLGTAFGAARVVVPSPDPESPEDEKGKDWTIDLWGYTGTVEEDLARRDFTIDAMALPFQDWPAIESPELAEKVMDPFNGRQDLAKKCIRAVNPHVFQDDPGRLLRTVHLAARLRFRFEPETVRMVTEAAPLISQVSGDRIRNEFLGILSMDGARGYLQVLDHLDLLCRVIPELADAKGVDQPKEHYWDVWDHSLHAVEFAELVTKGHHNSPIYTQLPWPGGREEYFNQVISDGHNRRTVLKLAALLHDVAKPQTKHMDETGRTRFPGHPELGAAIAETRLTQLHMSARGVAAVCKMVEEHLRPATMQQGAELATARAVYRYFRDLGDVAIDTLFLWMADHLAAKGPELDTDAWSVHARMVAHILELGAQPEVTAQKERLVTGLDLMERFQLVPGPLIGNLLAQIEEAQAVGELATRDDAFVLASKVLEKDGISNDDKSAGG
jgi:poly(A) polymerase